MEPSTILGAANSEPVKALIPALIQLTGLQARLDSRQIDGLKSQAEHIAATSDGLADAVELGRIRGFSAPDMTSLFERRQRNREAIAEKAVRQMSALPPAAMVQAPGEDWTDFYGQSCEGCSQDEMQEVWARVLVMESRQPGSYSRRSLDALRLFDAQDARLLKRLAALSFCVGDETYILYDGHYRATDFMDQQQDRRQAAATGLIHDTDAPRLGFYFESKESFTFDVAGQRFTATNPLDRPAEHAFWAFIATDLGRELLRLPEREPEDGLLRFLMECLDPQFRLEKTGR